MPIRLRLLLFTQTGQALGGAAMDKDYLLLKRVTHVLSSFTWNVRLHHHRKAAIQFSAH